MPKLFGSSFEDFKRRIDRRPWISLVVIGLVLLTTGSIYQFIDAQNYKRNVEASYNRALQDMVDNVRDLNVSLTKGIFCNSPQQFSLLSSEIFMQSEAAKANLGMLPLNDVQADNTARFLGQVGDYTYTLTKKSSTNQSLTDEDFEQLQSLQKYAEKLSDNLTATLSDVYAGKITLGRLKNITSQNIDKQAFSTTITNIEKDFANYPSLIYDGPFSSHVDKMESTYLKDKPQVSMEQARDKAKEVLGDKAKLIEYSGESNSTIKSYSFVAYPDPNKKERNIRIEMSALGGYCVYYLDNRQPQNGGMKVEDCKKIAIDFLGSKGYLNMKDSYFEAKDNIATINYAYTQGNYIIYPDLIKVKVSMDNGEVLGLESRGYLMSHQDKRDLPSPAITVAQAKSKIDKHLTIKSQSLAIIPTDGLNEVVCYEFKCNYENKNFIVYINAKTGVEEKILMLLESPEGILSM